MTHGCSYLHDTATVGSPIVSGCLPWKRDNTLVSFEVIRRANMTPSLHLAHRQGTHHIYSCVFNFFLKVYLQREGVSKSEKTSGDGQGERETDRKDRES